MIYVDRCRARGAPWPGGIACHLTSDAGDGELLDFARGVGIPMQWFRHRESPPHFELTPAWRKKAIAAGAHVLAAGRPGLA